MRIANDPPEGADIRGAFGELLRLQADFQARLAEETFRYLRRLQGALAPYAPGTVVAPAGEGELRGAGRPGGSVELKVQLENRQRAHCVVTAVLTPLVGPGGVTWFPAAEPDPPTALVAPGEESGLTVAVAVPDALTPGAYRGALLLQGFRDEGVPVVVDVSEAAAEGAA